MSRAPDPTARGGGLARRVAAAAAATGLALLALEIWVRAALPVGGVLYGHDRELLHDARPDAATVQPMPRATLGEGDAARVVVLTGPEGLRGAALADVPPGAARVLVIGDSMVMAENVPAPRTFVARLGAELTDALGRDVVTLNAGRSGYGPDQALLWLEREIERIRPDVVVCVLCAHNDLGDLMRNKLFRLDADGALVRERPTVGRRLLDRFDEAERRASAPVIVRLLRFATRPPFVDEVPADPMPRYLAALDAQFREHWIDGDDEVVSLFEDVYDADVALGLAPEAEAAKRALLAAVLARMGGVSAAGGALLRFVVVPSAVDVAPGLDIRVDAERYPSHDPGRLVSVHASAAAAVAPAFDVTESLHGDAGGLRDAFVGGTDVHWNAVGQGRAAEAVAGWLAEDVEVRAALGPRR